MIDPKILKGFRDSTPEIMIPKKKIIRTLESIFESYGFSPIDTPALEYTEILLGKGGGETDKQIYRFKDHGERDVALRFDLTVPLARFVSLHFNELTFPFKRYHIAPVWRGENTQKGRYREFYQCDFDILGSQSIGADYEILDLIRCGMETFDCGKFVINVNNRKLLGGILESMGLLDKSSAILQTIDKIFKIGRDEVKRILVSDNGIDAGKIEKLLSILKLDTPDKSGITGEEIFTSLNELSGMVSNEYKQTAADMISIFTFIKQAGNLDSFAFNPAITRGLDYYTGIVFETFVEDSKGFGSVCSGGRYDNLTGLYSKNVVTGIGASFGLDRLLALLEDKKLLGGDKTVSKAVIFHLDSNDIPYYSKVAGVLRNGDINCEMIFEKQKIQNQFKYAERKGIRWAIIAGSDEIANQTVNLKDITTGTEYKNLPINEIAVKVKNA